MAYPQAGSILVIEKKKVFSPAASDIAHGDTDHAQDAFALCSEAQKDPKLSDQGYESLTPAAMSASLHSRSTAEKRDPPLYVWY